MRIAVNGLVLSNKNTGAGRYVIDLINGLNNEKSKEVILFTDSNLRESGIITNEIVEIYDTGLIQRFRPVRLAWENLLFPRVLRSQKIDLLHAACFNLPFNISCRSIVTIFDLTFFIMPQVHEKSKVIYFRSRIPPTLKRADKIIAISEQTKSDIISLFKVPAEKIEVVYIGVGKQFSPSADSKALEWIKIKYGLPEKYILFVGTIEPRKNLINLVHAYARIKNKFAHGLVIAGKLGWGYAELFETVKKLNIDGVFFTGFVPDEDMPLVYNGADVFVYPSFYEGFGIPVVEAMASGVPVVTSNVSSLAEIGAGAAVLVDPRQVEQISSAIEGILTDKSYAQGLVKMGLERAARFSQEKMVAKTFNLYYKVLAGC